MSRRQRLRGRRTEFAVQFVIENFERVPGHGPRGCRSLDPRPGQGAAPCGVRDGIPVPAEEVAPGVRAGICHMAVSHSSSVQSRTAAASRSRAWSRPRPRLSTQIDAIRRDGTPREAWYSRVEKGPPQGRARFILGGDAGELNSRSSEGRLRIVLQAFPPMGVSLTDCDGGPHVRQPADESFASAIGVSSRHPGFCDAPSRRYQAGLREGQPLLGVKQRVRVGDYCHLFLAA